jgi:hypothetical protein
MVLADFAPLVGDRRQEIVFIGVGMDEVSGWLAFLLCLGLRGGAGLVC